MPNLFLEVARGLAALWVFAFHVMPLIAESSPHGALFASHGHLGVPLFFVISGYCLYSAAASTLRGKRSPWDFLQRRFLRIFPPFWLSMLVLVALPFLIEAISSIKSGHFTVPQPAWQALDAVDWLQIATLTRVFTAHDGDLQSVFTVFNAVYWTLAIEFQFYLVMFAVLFVPRWWKHVLVAVCMLSLIPGLTGMPGLFLPYWPSFFVGLVLRWTHERGATANRLFGARTPVVAGVLLAGLVAAGLAGVYVRNLALALSAMDGQVTMVCFALYAATILWLGGGIEQALAGRAVGGAAGCWLMRPFLLLGASSYSLYLLHGKLFHLPELFIRQVVPTGSSLYPVLTMVATAFLCYLFYLCCEKPFMSKRYQRRLADELEDRSVPVHHHGLAVDVTPLPKPDRNQ
jgi:peptidoglycan/LPS O-acetylase OafA/YrhL